MDYYLEEDYVEARDSLRNLVAMVRSNANVEVKPELINALVVAIEALNRHISVPGEINDLKPCPFCGGDAVVLKCNDKMRYKVSCINCGSTVFSNNLDDEKTAICAWNRRTTDDE